MDTDIEAKTLARSIVTARSVLFVPGDRPERFDKAAASGADVIVLDLEDAVAPDAKTDARRHVEQWLSRGNRACVRVNGIGTDWIDDDLDVTRKYGASVMLPKSEQPDDIRYVCCGSGPRAGVIALIETAAGVLNAAALCAVDVLTRVAFGSADLAAELGIDPADSQALMAARGQLVLASAAHRLPRPIDAVTLDVRDSEMLSVDCAHAKALGFGGKLCVHPNQVDAVNEFFVPSSQEIVWAREVIAAATGAGGVVAHDGQMIDKPVLDRAHRILHRS